MSKRLKTIITVSLVGFALVMFSVIQSPSAKIIFVSLVSLAQYLVINSGKVITSPVCYGSIGLLLMYLALSYLTHYQRVERREAREQARQQRREDFEKRMQELRESKSSLPRYSLWDKINEIAQEQKKIISTLAENVKAKTTRRNKASAYPYGVPIKKYEEWARWKRCYGIIKPLTSQSASWDEIKSFIENNHEGLPSSLDTLRSIFNAGNDGLLDKFPPEIKTPS